MENYSKAEFRFYQELNDFLPKDKRGHQFVHHFYGKPSIKEVIESYGPPHTEVDLVLVNGVSVDFNYHLKDKDQVSVYPTFESLDIVPLVRLRPIPLRETKFIADVHLKALTKYLRLIGFDTYFDENLDDFAIIEKSISEERIILTRDLGILKNGRVTHGSFIRHIQPKAQLIEVALRFDLKKSLKPFSRCLECNGQLVPIDKEKIEQKLLPETRAVFNKFLACNFCGKIYWEGSHYPKLQAIVETIATL